jgi:hypothetical protein
MFMATTLFLVFGGIELATRIVYDAPQATRQKHALTMSEPDPNRIWRYKANYSQRLESSEFSTEIQTRGWQLRDEDPIGTEDVRILAVGDSFTFVWGVEEEDRYSEILENLLADHLPGKTVKVLNAGHWMSTFDQHLLIIKELVPRFKPHLVLHGVYAGHVVTIGEHDWVTDARGHIRQVRFAGIRNEISVREDGALQRTNRLIESPPLKSLFLAKVLRRYY